MPGRLKSLLQGLRPVGASQALGAYKGFLGANVGGAVAGGAAAAAYSAMPEGPGPVTGTVVLAPAFMGVGAAIQSAGGIGALRNNARAAVSRAMAKGSPGANPFAESFRTRAAPIDPMARIQRALDGIDAAPAHMQYAALATELELAGATGEAIGHIGPLTNQPTAGGFAGKFDTAAQIIERAEKDPEFAAQFSQRMSDFEGIGDFVDADPRELPRYPTRSYRGTTRKGLINRLKKEGHGALAREIAGMPTDIHVKGIGIGENLTAIEYGLTGRGGEVFRVPIVGPNGVVKAGEFGRNSYIARKQIYLGSLEGLGEGGRPQVVNLDMAVAKTIRDQYGNVNPYALQGYLTDLANMPIRMKGHKRTAMGLGSALAWGRSHRPDRIGAMTQGNIVMHGMEAQLSVPKSASLRTAWNLDQFMERDMLSSDTILAMRQAGWAQMGSEGSVRKGSFYNIGAMARIAPGSYMTPIDKNVRGIRDFTKPYYTRGAMRYQRRPFSTAVRNRILGASQGMAVHYNAVLEAEVDWISREVMYGSNPRAAVERALGGSVTDATYKRFREVLDPIARMREGQFAMATPEGVKMVQDIDKKVVYSLPRDVAKLKPGDALPGIIGYDATNRPISHTYSRLGGGEAILRKIEPVNIDNKTAYLVSWSEQQAADTVKWGSDVGKMYALRMRENSVPDAIRFINGMRRNLSNAGIYSNESWTPLIGGRNADARYASAFTLAETFTKVHSGPEILATTIYERMMPNMSRQGRRATRQFFKKHGIRVGPDGLMGNFRSPADIESAMGALKGLSQQMVDSPGAFGLGDMFQGFKYGEGARADQAAAAVLLRGGIVSEAMPWDALNINVPTKIPITTNQLNIMRGYGMNASVSELLGRRGLSGDAQATEAYKLAMRQFLEPGAKMSSNMPIVDIKEFNSNLSPAQRRKTGFAKNNFLLDLEVAGTQLDVARLKRELGIDSLKIPVPGTNTDFYRKAYKVASGSMAESEEWVGPLQRLVRSVEGAYQGNIDYKYMRQQFSDYLNSLRGMDAAMTVGRGGSVYDTGASIAGRMSFRDYGRQFKGHTIFGGKGRFLVGVNPEDFAGLARKGASYAYGVSTRFPATTVDPIMLIPDASVARGEIAMDEARRALMGADFDGDTMYASVIKSEGGVKEVSDIIAGRGAAGAAYEEAFQARALLGGVADDLAALGAAGDPNVFPNIFKKMTERVSKFVGIGAQSEGTVLGKSYTQFIGRFSNLANEYIMGSNAMEGVPKLARAQLLRDIQQAAIDFGRKSSGVVDPAAISRMLSEAVTMASSGAIDEANSLFEKVMLKLNIGDKIEQHLNTLKVANKNNPKYLASLDEYASALGSAKVGFFSPLATREAQQRFAELAEAQKIIQGKVFPGPYDVGSPEEVKKALVDFGAQLDAQEALAGQGVPSLGRASEEVTEQLTMWNRAAAKMRGATHILGESWQAVKQSQHFGTMKTGAMITGGLLAARALFSSPTEMGAPAYEGRQRSISHSPDVALASMNGAPMPGSAYGHAHRGGEWRNPRRVNKVTPPQNTIPRRYYVNQTNRVPRMRFTASGDPYDSNQLAVEAASQIQRMAGGQSTINVVHDVTGRRMSEMEMSERLRSDLRGGR